MTGGQVIPMPGMPQPQAQAGFATDQGLTQNFMAALAIIKDPQKRKLRIDIESDSMIVLDEQQEKQARVEFLTAVGNFMTAALPVAQAEPQMMPLLMKMLLFGVRGFKAGRDLETTFEQAEQAMTQAAAQPKPPPPEQQAAQAQMQLQQAKGHQELQIKQLELEMRRLELQIAQLQAQAKAAEISGQDPSSQADVQLKAAQAQKTQREAEAIGAQTQQTVGASDAMNNSDADRQQLSQLIQQMLQSGAPQQLGNLAQAFQQHVAETQAHRASTDAQIQALARPKQVAFVRGPDGRIAGAQVH